MSDEKQETRDDIIAEMRNLGKLDEKSTDKIPRSLMGLGLRTLADRLEAAAKRERNNAAAMRDALEAYVEYSERALQIVMYTHDRLKAITAKARDALSKPPRNCDVLSADQCKKMFENEMHIYMPKEAIDRDRDIARIVANGVIDALFAEHKGENNGK